MKQLFFGLLLSIIILGSCIQPKSNHTAQWSSDGKDSVVNVVYVDNSGNTNTFFMNYLLFHTLFNGGGYGNVYNYYHSHPYEFNSGYATRYKSYSSSYTPKTNPYHRDYGSQTTSKSYSSPSRSTPSKSYTSPSRSYSSPSRSYSSPSRSYSSPSRSYSSPSRSYSSPSRRH